MSTEKETVIKKPSNSFFIYRKAMKDRIVKMYGVTKSHQVSKIASECWKQEPPEVRQYFMSLSAAAHNEFKLANPSFNWQPWKDKGKDDKVTKRRNSVTSPLKVSRSLESISNVPTSPMRCSKSLEGISFKDEKPHSRPVISIPVRHQRSLSMEYPYGSCPELSYITPSPSVSSSPTSTFVNSPSNTPVSLDVLMATDLGDLTPTLACPMPIPDEHNYNLVDSLFNMHFDEILVKEQGFDHYLETM
ncbi:hypothetical protein HDV04_003422 [Boothiomyces sp. JEL0838]|nr:hypothetical protein HDV04_003422 [Boothiomyces sp. JEL0838]